MRIAVDISQIVFSGTGVARYTQFLVKALNSDTKNDYVYFLSTLRGRLDAKSQNLLKNRVVKKFSLPPIALDVLWNRLHIAPIEKFVGDIDVFISSDWIEPPVESAKKITIVHDLVVYRFPETSTQKSSLNLKTMLLSPNIVETQKRRLNWVKKESDLIIVDSTSTADDLQDILKINKEKIKVVYPGVEITVTPSNKEKILKKYNITLPFFLTVGKMEPRKNIPRLIEVFQKINNQNITLLVVGPSGWGDNNFNNSNKIRFLGYVPDEDLYALYQSCHAFVMPSLYEGFGYPLVEAMMMGAPCATSNTSSLSEIGKNSSLFFDPKNEKDIEKTLLSLIKNNQLRNQLKEKSKERAKFFNFQRYRDEIIKVINNLP